MCCEIQGRSAQGQPLAPRVSSRSNTGDRQRLSPVAPTGWLRAAPGRSGGARGAGVKRARAFAGGELASPEQSVQALADTFDGFRPGLRLEEEPHVRKRAALVPDKAGQALLRPKVVCLARPVHLAVAKPEQLRGGRGVEEVLLVCDERVPTPIVPTVHQDAAQARVRRARTTVGRRGEHAVHRAIDSSVAGGRSAGGGEGRSASARSAHALHAAPRRLPDAASEDAHGPGS